MNLDNAKKSLTSPTPEIVAKGLQLIGKFGKLPDLQVILNYTKHANAQIKNQAISSASDLIRGNLIAHFQDLEPQVRQKLGMIMETLDPLVIDEIIKDLYSDDNDRRVRAIQILGLLKKNPKIRELMATLVQDRNEKIRATAVNLLGRIIGPENQDLILSLLNDKDKRVKANTVEALEAVGNKKIIPILLRYRKDPNNRIRGNVLKALFTLGYSDLEIDLLEMLKSSDNFMRASGLWVISKIKLISVGLEDLAGFYILSDNEMVYNNAKLALSAFNTPRSKGYIKYLDKENFAAVK